MSQSIPQKTAIPASIPSNRREGPPSGGMQLPDICQGVCHRAAVTTIAPRVEAGTAFELIGRGELLFLKQAYHLC